MAANAVGVEEEALCGIGDGIEDLFGLIGGGRGSSEGCRGGDAAGVARSADSWARRRRSCR